MKWADPVEDDFKKKASKIRSKYDLPKKWADDLSVKVRSKFNYKTIMSTYDDVLEQVLGENK